MADTLKIAGRRHLSASATSSRRSHGRSPPEQAVLDRYVFLPHARTGIAAALRRPPFDPGPAPARATVEMTVPVIDDRGRVDAEMTMHVYGPADVTEIDPRQVIRTFPKADAAQRRGRRPRARRVRPAGPALAVHARRPDAPGRLVPWITLVVAERRHVEWGEQRGADARGARSAATSCSRWATRGPGRTPR